MQSIRLVFIGLAMTVLFSAGCSSSFFSGGSSNVNDTYIAEFPDVPIPRDMSIDSGATEVSQVGNMRVGYMRFTGSVEWLSLTDATIYNLHAQGWSPLAIYKNKNGLLVFQKDERICAIVINDSLASTGMRVWVSPKMNGFTVPPTMPVAPVSSEPLESYEDVSGRGSSSYSGGGSSSSSSSSGSSSGGSSSIGGGMSEQSLDE